MNGKLSKKLRRIAHKKLRTDLEHLVFVLSKEGTLTRIKYAIKIVFKKHNIKFETKVHG
jgi:hypothetical protein